MDSILQTDLKGRPLARFLRLLAVDKKEISHIYLYAIFGGIIYLSLPLGIQAVISLALANQISSSWLILTAVVTLGTLLLGVLQLMQISLTESIQQKIFVRSSMEFAFRLPKLRMDALIGKYPPELVNRFFDTLTLQKGLPKILIDLSTASLQILFGLLVLSFYHPLFIIFGSIIILILFLIFRLSGPRGLETSLKESDFKYKVVYWLEEVARTLGSFKMAGKSTLAMKKTDSFVKKYLQARKQHFRVLVFQFGWIILFKTVVTAGLLILGSLLLIDQQLNVGQFVASEIIIIQIIGSVEKVVLNMETIYDVLTAVEKLGKVTDIPLENGEGAGFKNLEMDRAMSVGFRDVSFTFPGNTTPSLQNVDLHILPHEKVCINGENGSGKTMMLNLISGLYTNYTGTLSYNGIHLKNLGIQDLRANIGDCLSQKNLFKGTIMENITMGNEEIPFKDIEWAIESVGLLEFVNSLPDGLNSNITPESPLIPFSIKKKMILARCIVKRPGLLLMDDFLTIWNPGERGRICRFLTSKELETVVAVSSERSFANVCDKIIMMRGGKVEAVGKPEEILQYPSYNKLFH
ncbi:MAG: ABC transporter ATP-binding protein [Bacteroidota bacterium]